MKTAVSHGRSSQVRSPGSTLAPSTLTSLEEFGEPGRQVAALLGSLQACDFTSGTQLLEGEDWIKANIRAKKQQIRKAGEQLKAQYSIQVDQQMRAQEMLLEQASSVQLMRLQQTIHLRRAQLDQQAAALTSEYSQRKVHEQFLRQQEDLEQEFRKQQEREAKRIADQAAKLQASAAEVASMVASADLAATVINAIVSAPSIIETLAPQVGPLASIRSSAGSFASSPSGVRSGNLAATWGARSMVGVQSPTGQGARGSGSRGSGHDRGQRPRRRPAPAAGAPAARAPAAMAEERRYRRLRVP